MLLTSATRPSDRSVPRYWPHKPLPPYRYLPGLDPHPLRDPAGHSYHPDARLTRHRPWRSDDWQRLPAWLWGVDLFNAFYFWEAHESWEGLWSPLPRESSPALLLQGFIQIAAALLKIRLQSLEGAMALSRSGLEKIARVSAATPLMLGLGLGRVLDDFANYFRPLAERTLPSLDASVPLLVLSGQLEAAA